jgi:hypothetical protein
MNRKTGITLDDELGMEGRKPGHGSGVSQECQLNLLLGAMAFCSVNSRFAA